VSDAGIEIANLSKTYRVAKKKAGLGASIRGLFSREWTEVHAVRDLSFSIKRGERVGFLGPNGAGKTTTLKMLAGLLTPTSGRISVLGFNPRGRPRELLRQITLVMGQKQQLFWDLPPIETMELNRAVYEIDRGAYEKTLSELVKMLDLSELLEKPTRQLSLGERMKCELAAALLHRPQVLFLDEPTIGLDVTMQAIVRRFIREYNEATGAAVILTSHNMDDVTALCPRVIVIDHGRLKHDGDLRRLAAEVALDKRITVHLQEPLQRTQIEGLAVNGRAIRVVEEEGGTTFTVQSAAGEITETVRVLLGALSVADLRVEDPPLEDVMQKVFGAPMRDDT
jgi:ABC-2 type transport system ATP-binding protein